MLTSVVEMVIGVGPPQKSGTAVVIGVSVIVSEVDVGLHSVLDSGVQVEVWIQLHSVLDSKDTVKVEVQLHSLSELTV